MQRIFYAAHSRFRCHAGISFQRPFQNCSDL
ncbi:Uncharacterised protein [Vibrio cholerae]|nr:Uncharacterised protein [Vibrio cholerae]CSI14506.1 Uncharacterised protein [Vibrio cholerae]